MINAREIKFNNVFDFQMAYWTRGGIIHEIIGRWDHEFSYGYDPMCGDILWMLRQTLKPGDVFMDIGSSFGLFSLAALRSVGKTGFIYCLEPNPVNVQLLSLTVAKNNLVNRLHIHPVLAHSSIGTQSVLTGHSRIPIETVNTMTLSSFNYYKGIPSTFKISSNEVDVLQGGMDLLTKHNSTTRLVIDVHPTDYNESKSLEPLLEQLLGIGYKFKFVSSAGYHSPKVLKELGYEPHLIFQDGNYSHGVYTDMDEEHILRFATQPEKSYIPDVEEWTSKVLRCIVLEKKVDKIEKV